jgi:photosystem II stability/assembly factor-like uncharacterized protein
MAAARLALLATSALALAPLKAPATTPRDVALAAENRRRFLGTGASAAAALAIAPAAPANALDVKAWKQVNLPVTTTLFDIAFDTKDHGYLVGSKGTFLETVDGGASWKPRTFANLDEEEELGIRFERVSFKDGEGWVVASRPSSCTRRTRASPGSASRSRPSCRASPRASRPRARPRPR